MDRLGDSRLKASEERESAPTAMSSRGPICYVVDPANPERFIIQAAVRQLIEGKLLAYPTETLYGLGADPRQSAALGRLLRAKGRSAGHGLLQPSSFSPASLSFFRGVSPVFLGAYGTGCIASSISGGSSAASRSGCPRRDVLVLKFVLLAARGLIELVSAERPASRNQSPDKLVSANSPSATTS